MSVTDFLNYARLLLYPILIYGIFLLTSKITRRAAIFTVAALWLTSLEAVLIFRLLSWDVAYNFTVNYIVSPLLAVFAWATWWTLWKERKKV